MSLQTQKYSSKQAEILRKHLYGSTGDRRSEIGDRAESANSKSHSIETDESSLVKKDLLKTLLLSTAAVSIQVILYFGIQNGLIKI